MTYNVLMGTLNPTHSLTHSRSCKIVAAKNHFLQAICHSFRSTNDVRALGKLVSC